MTGPTHYRQGEEWLTRAKEAHARIRQDPTAAKEAESAAAIATAHFAAAKVAAGLADGRGAFEAVDWRRAVGTL